MLDLLSLLARPSDRTLPRLKGTSTVLVFAAFALAAAAPAQTFTLWPKAAGLYRMFHQNAYTLRYSTKPHVEVPAYTTVGFSSDHTSPNVWSSSNPFPAYAGSSVQTYVYETLTTIIRGRPSTTTRAVDIASFFRYGWLANFALPALPEGMQVASASLAVSAGAIYWLDYSNWGQLTTSYYGSVQCLTQANAGALVLPPPSTRADPPPGKASLAPASEGVREFDVTEGVAGLLAQGSPFAQFQIDQRDGNTYNLRYAKDPNLTLVYGYPVRVPVTLASFIGDATKVPVEVQFRKPGTMEVVSARTLYPDATGAVSLVAVPGTYDVSLKAPRFLRRTLRSVVVRDASPLPAVTLVNGDVNGDGYVTAADRALVTNALGTQVGQAGYSAAADVTGDGFVTAKDRAVVTLALGTAGDD